MNSRFISVKYLAVFLLAIAFLFLVSLDAFSQTRIDLGVIANMPLMIRFY